MAEGMTEALDRLSKNLLEAGSTQGAIRMRAVMLAAAAPAPDLIRQEALATLPARGGLNQWVADASAKILTVGGGSKYGVVIRARKTGHDLKSINAGAVRHRVFGEWRGGVPTQNVKPGFFIRPVEKVIVPAVSLALRLEMAETARRLTT